MEKYKKLKLSLITLLLALIVALTAAVFAVKGGKTSVYADERPVTLDGNSVFYTALNGAEIGASDEVSEDDGSHRFTLFNIGTDETLAYRQNLAYKWISSDKDGEGEITGHSVKTMSMEFYFPEVNFKRFYIRFQSQQYVFTKDGKSENYLIFTPNDDKSGVKIYVAQTMEEDEDGSIEGLTEIGTAAVDERIKISLGAYENGNYVVQLNGIDTQGKFENVYEKYAEYVASGDSAVTPLTFGAQFEGDSVVETENGAKFVLVDISGQSFEMHDKSGTYQIIDTAAPVMCFSQTPSYLEYGKSIGFQYKVIDVLANITTGSSYARAYYYVLTGDQYEDPDFEYDRTDYSTDSSASDGESGGENEGEGEGETEKKKESPFIEVTSSSNIRISSDDQTFIPQKYLKSDVMGLVKIYYEIFDVSYSSSRAQKDIVFVDWYVEEALGAENGAFEKITLKGSNEEATFLKLIKSKEGATYAREGDTNLTRYKQSVQAFQTYYQTKIDDAIKELEDGKLYAGGNKFYLPALEGANSADASWNFSDDYLIGTDYKYSLYYKGINTSSNTSLAFNKLSIELNDADVEYRFTIYITDAFGNPMRYPSDELDENGEVVWKEIKTTDVWDEDFADLLPYFTFEVSYKEATAEDPENLSLSYVGSSYSGVSFKITGVSGTYTSSYKLYVFDRSRYYEDTKDNSLNYETFTAHTAALLDNTYKEGVNTRKYFKTVKAASELLESDVNYDDFKALNWNSTNVTFTPQSVDDFYVVELELTDNRSQTSTLNYATVAASMQTKSLKGETDWLGDNKTSIILFSVAGVCLIALIVLLVVKPKDKGDIDAIYTEVEEKSKSGNKKQKTEKKK